MGYSGAQALAALKEAPLLHTLTLNLWNSSVENSGSSPHNDQPEFAWLSNLTIRKALGRKARQVNSPQLVTKR